MNVLYAYAAAVEAGPLPSELTGPTAGFLELGVGKAASAHALTRRLAVEPPDLLVLFGVCGAHSDLDVGDLCVVTEEHFADEGVATEDGFLTLPDLGLPEPAELKMDASASATVAGLLAAATVRGSTVSTCSGTDALAAARADRTGAAIETMEGAAVALVCQRMEVPMVQIRCVSNRTGDRDRAGWDLASACVRLQDAVRRVARAFAIPGGDR